jgi:hypothetical protein
MKSKTIVIFALALSIGVAARVGASGSSSAKAVVKVVRGNCFFQKDGSWLPVKVNMPYYSGVVFRTGANSSLDLSVNGLSSAVRIEPDTVVAIPLMARSGPGRDADSQTMLDLRSGAILGDVRKLPSGSRYEIKTPHGIAGMRFPADFHVIATPQPDAHNDVTFTCVAGKMIVSAQAMPNSQNVIKTLKDGRSWTPGEGDIHRTPRDLLRQYQGVLNPRLSLDGPPDLEGPVIVDPFPAGGQSLTRDGSGPTVPGNSKK